MPDGAWSLLRSRWRRTQRLDVCHQCSQLFFAHQPLKNRHDGLESAYHLRARTQDRFANIVFVRHHASPVFQLHRLAENSHQVGTATLSIRAMTGGAPQLLKNALATRSKEPSGSPPTAMPGIAPAPSRPPVQSFPNAACRNIPRKRSDRRLAWWHGTTRWYSVPAARPA